MITTIQLSNWYEWVRLDKVLSDYFSISRNFIQHLICRGSVVDMNTGLPLKKSYLCRCGDVVGVKEMNRFDDDMCLVESPHISLPILHETNDYAVIYKPKWVYSHPTSLWEITQPSVVWFLYHHYWSIPSIGTFIRAGLLHRLDKETDWVMIVALSELGLAHFRGLFYNKSVAETISDKEKVLLKKRYRCMVQPWGQSAIAILHHIIRNTPYIIDAPVLAKVPWATQKSAITIIHSVTMNNLSDACIELEIMTGRTHQIRIHCAKVLQSPIKWDTLYWNKKQSWSMMLTAFRLLFIDPLWQIHTIELEWQRHDSTWTRSFVHNWIQHYHEVNVEQSSLINMQMEMQ